LLEVGGELLSEWLSLDSKLLRSLRALLRPGRLSELYLEGKRAPFLRPFRLYLMATLILFSTVLTLETPDATGLNIYIGGQQVISPATGEEQFDFQILNDETSVGRWLIGRSSDQIARMRELPRQQVVDTIFAGLRRMLSLTPILFVPFLALGLKLLYLPIRRKSRERAVRTLYVDHLVFALHFQSFKTFAVLYVYSQLMGLAFGLAVLAAIRPL
jgi:hypothetical protein